MLVTKQCLVPLDFHSTCIFFILCKSMSINYLVNNKSLQISCIQQKKYIHTGQQPEGKQTMAEFSSLSSS